jgi:acetyl esterase/lipase
MRRPRSRLLRQGLSRAVLAVNARHPVPRNPVLTVPSFFGSWLVTEAAPVVLGVWGLRTAAEVARRRGRLDRSDWAGLALTAAAGAGLVQQMRVAARSDEELHAALSPLVPSAHLDQRPSSLRTGAFLPVLNGRTRRRRTRGVVYSGTDPHRLELDVYEPLDRAPGHKRPAIVQIHGGAWVVGSKDEQGIPLLNHLAANGWVGFNVNYRLSPRAKYPDHLVDCKAALVWIREHAEEYGIDPDFIAVTGGSAGGHLTALMALTQGDPAFQPGFEEADTSVQAAVPFYGVYDLLDREDEYLPSFAKVLGRVVMGTDALTDPDAWSSYSPLERVSADAPPMMVVHGDIDVLAPVGAARRFVAALRAVSRNPVVYAELHGAQHAFEIFPSIRTVRTVEYVERFLSWVQGEHLAGLTAEEQEARVVDDTPEQLVHHELDVSADASTGAAAEASAG